MGVGGGGFRRTSVKCQLPELDQAKNQHNPKEGKPEKKVGVTSPWSGEGNGLYSQRRVNFLLVGE